MKSSSQPYSFSIFKQQSECGTRLFCFPYAGATGSIYRPWAAALSGRIHVCAANLPGRDFTCNQEQCASISEMADALLPVVLPLLNRPFALFGHSMGSLLAFELACRLQSNYDASLLHLFVSGHPAPQLPYTRAPLHALPEQEFIKEIKLLNGTPPEIWEHPDLVKLFLPLLRRDFRLVETYQYTRRALLLCSMTVLGGTEDTSADPEELEAWRANTTGNFHLKMFPGDHFFLHSAQEMVLKEIQQTLHGHSPWFDHRNRGQSATPSP